MTQKENKRIMSYVHVYNEWDPLQEVIVGRAENAQIAQPDRGLFAIEYRDCGEIEAIPSGRYPHRVLEETEEDLLALIHTFEQLGITVRRPEPFEHDRCFGTAEWSTDGQYNYCPRDLFLPVGTTLIEAPMTLRARFLETLSFKSILLDYLR